MAKASKNQSVAEHNWMYLQQHYHHYKHLDFSYWRRKADYAMSRIEHMSREKSSYPYYLELYTDYIQLFEAVAINMRAMLSVDLFKCLFIKSDELRESVSKLFPKSISQESPDVDKWVRGLVFHRVVFGEYIATNPEQRVREYKGMLQESAQDYLKDYQLLNAFKHGFRTRVSGKGIATISSGSGNEASDSYVVGQYTSSITYFSLAIKQINGEKIKVVCENQISFNYQRVYQKIAYMSNSLENARRAILHVAKSTGTGKQIALPQILKVMDVEEFNKHCDVLRWCRPIHPIA